MGTIPRKTEGNAERLPIHYYYFLKGGFLYEEDK